MAEYIFEISDVLYDKETGEAVMKLGFKGKLVRCKYCKHKPRIIDVFHASYGDVPVLESDKCPCVNKDDYFYSHMPDDDWFCGNGERRTDE